MPQKQILLTQNLNKDEQLTEPYEAAFYKSNMIGSVQSLSYVQLCDPMDYTVHEILQARILEWVAFPFSRGSSQPRDQTRFPALQADSLPAEPQGKPHLKNTHPLKQP